MIKDSVDSFAGLVEPHRRELLVHCYRMLGSIDDAEDAVQETLTRAWRGRASFQRDVSFRAWLYRIATNVCLDARARRSPRGETHADTPEVGPIPDALLEQASVGPEARYDTKESISLAFMTVLQVLPPRQRAVLILRDVLTWRAAEVAMLLDVSVPAVNSALHRARTTVSGSYPGSRTPTASKGHLDPGQLRSVVDRYVRAWESADIAGLVALLRDDAVLAMPPEPSVVGATAIGALLARTLFANGHQHRLLATAANGAPAFVVYRRDGRDGPFGPYAVIVLEEITEAGGIARFIGYFDPGLARWFGLPAEIAR